MRRLFHIGGAVAIIHALEDVALLSIGRFLPVPVWAMYVIGIGISTLILTTLFERLLKKRI
jgi:hypothetical protein